MQHKYGWIPDLPDQRDRPYALLTTVAPPLPPFVDLRSHCTAIEDQGELGSCTANALVGNLEFLKKKTLGTSIDFSRLFLYYNERLLEHAVKIDRGASLRDGIKSLVKTGDCTEQIWPYEVSKFAKKPSKIAYKEALDYQITSYYRLSGLSELKHTLARGFPFVFGIAVYESLESENVTRTGTIPIPKLSERLLGGHALMAVGFNDEKEMIIFRNSWGKLWGKSGYGTLPYAYITSPGLAADFWTIRDME